MVVIRGPCRRAEWLPVFRPYHTPDFPAPRAGRQGGLRTVTRYRARRFHPLDIEHKNRVVWVVFGWYHHGSLPSGESVTNSQNCEQQEESWRLETTSGGKPC